MRTAKSGDHKRRMATTCITGFVMQSLNCSAEEIRCVFDDI